MSTFQSYLVLGKGKKSREKTISLANSLGISFDFVSPDVFIISPQKNHITIDQIRELKSHIFEKPIAQKFKLVVIEDAHGATPEAQNALLKILEEPPLGAIIVLEAQSKSPLLPTLVSRLITFKADEDEMKVENEQSFLLDQKNVLNSLELIAGVNDPKSWLDQQMIQLHKQLLLKTRLRNKKGSTYQPAISILEIAKLLEKCARAKEMVEANVNPKFALLSLVISDDLASK